jgi:hypothetical protein
VVLNRKILLVVVLALLVTSFIWIPAAVFATKDEVEKFQYYVEALRALLNGLIEYFKAVISLFKEACAT